MKTQILLLSFMTILFNDIEHKNPTNNFLQESSLNQKHNTKNISLKKIKELHLNKKLDTIKKEAPFKVLKSSPNLRYTVRKIGTGNSVLFSIKNGRRKLPKLTFSMINGDYTKVGYKEGFENVLFPFKSAINCLVSYSVYRFDNRPSLINGFEIEINEPGNWEIVFQ